MTDKPVVFSTDSGRMCPDCSSPVAKCSCKSMQQQKILGDGNVKVSRSTKGRKGKGVSIISGLAVTGDELREIAKEIKRAIGVGGAVKGREIEIQSDDRDKILKLLEGRGIKGTLAGS